MLGAYADREVTSGTVVKAQRISQSDSGLRVRRAPAPRALPSPTPGCHGLTRSGGPALQKFSAAAAAQLDFFPPLRPAAFFCAWLPPLPPPLLFLLRLEP